ncbi:MAG: TolB family protein, partial [archaeon]
MTHELRLNDLGKFRMIARPRLSNNAEKISYLVTIPDGDEYKTILEVVDRKNGEKLWSIDEGNPSNPEWAPYGDKLLFTSRKGMNKEEKGTGIWVTDNGADPELVARFNGGVSQPRWSGNGEYIFFISGTGEDDSEVKLIDDIPIWYNGEGWTYYKTKHLHMVNPETGEVRIISEGEMDIQCYSVSHDGTKIAYSQSGNRLRPGESDLIIIDTATDERERILSSYMIHSLA